MKSTHVKNETNKRKEKINFPCLMEVINPNIKYKIILVTGETKIGHSYKGIMVFKGESLFEVGEKGKWAKSCFKPLPKGEQIIIEN